MQAKPARRDRRVSSDACPQFYQCPLTPTQRVSFCIDSRGRLKLWRSQPTLNAGSSLSLARFALKGFSLGAERKLFGFLPQSFSFFSAAFEKSCLVFEAPAVHSPAPIPLTVDHARLVIQRILYLASSGNI
jgi:hypothetical protein